MRKPLSLLLVCLLALLMLCQMLACTPDTPPVEPPDDPGSDDPTVNDPDKDDPTQPSTPTTGDRVVLVANGVSEYRIVISDVASSETKSLAQSLRRAFETVTGVKPALVNDWEDHDNNDAIKEILVGDTNRKASATMKAQLGSTDYGIAVMGSKIVLAGNGDTLEFAVATFLSTYLGYQNEESFATMTAVELPNDLHTIRSIYGDRSVLLYVTKDSLGYVDDLQEALKAEWGSLKVATLDTPVDEVFDAEKSSLVIIAGVDTVPAVAKPALATYLNNDGRVLMLGGPAFESLLYEYDGKWYDASNYGEAILRSLDDDCQEIILDTWSKTLTNDLRPSSDNSTAVVKTIGNYGLSGSSRQLFYEVKNLSSWATSELRVNVTLEAANLLSFYAKPGDDHTEGFSFEIEESNGARWFAVVPFTSNDWKLYTYMPSDFTWYKSSPSPRGSEPDLSDITKIRIGWASSHSKFTAGHHSFYLSDMTLSYLESEMTSTENIAFELDGVAPLYEQYPITNGANVVTEKSQLFVTERDYVLPETLVSCHPGASGIGYGNDANSRFIPLLRVTDEKGLHSGYAAWIDLYASTSTRNGDIESSMVGYFGAVSEDFYNADGIAAVVETAVAMTRNTFLVDGGTKEHIYVSADTEDIVAGAQFVTLPGFSENDGQLSVQVTLYEGDRSLVTYSTADFSTIKLKNSIQALQASYALKNGQPDRAVTTLSLDGKIIDRIEQDIHFWEAKPASERKFVYTEDGYFKRDGKIVNFFGVNYSPSYNAASGTNDSGVYVYDPTVVYQDLLRIKELGMNAVAMWVDLEDMTDCNDILDILRMCEELELYVDLSVRGYTYPLKKFNAEKAETLIRHLHFHENDIIYAYDIAWEHRIGNYDGNWAPNDSHGPGYFIGRQAWDDDFTAWVKVQYGSVETAEAAWGVKLSRTSKGELLVTDAMLDDTSDKYQKAIAAYYRFIDDIVSIQMQENLATLESLAPDQLISFRMSMSGSALRTSNFKPSTHCFDFQTLASTMDFMQPEGYQLAATDAKALQITFANAYARYAQPDSPIVWKEFGYHVWPDRVDGNFYPSEDIQRMAAAYYEYVFSYALTAHSSGMFCWYSTSGYRVDEDSDYGIYNPDGSDRPLTALIREYAPKFIAQGEREGEVLIEIEKDDYVGGIYGMFDEISHELAMAHAAGKPVTFVNAKQNDDGQYAYADTLTAYAVGDAKPEGGTYPLRYVNGLVKRVDIEEKNGKTYAQITVCNTKQSIWRAGTVSLVSTDLSDILLDYTFAEDVDYLENVTFEVEISGKGALDLRFEVNGVPFGPLHTAKIQ